MSWGFKYECHRPDFCPENIGVTPYPEESVTYETERLKRQQKLETTRDDGARRNDTDE